MGGRQRTKDSRPHPKSENERLVSQFDNLSFGRVIKGIVCGRWDADSDRERRSMATNVLTAGGYLVPSELASEIIDLARNTSVVMAAGARTVAMGSDSLSIARVVTDPTMEQKSENAAFAGSNVALDRINFAARTFGTIVRSSRELAEDAPNFPELISQVISNALAAEIDKQCLVGSATGGVGLGGLQRVGGINTVTSVGTPTTWSKWVVGVGAIWQDNHRPNAYVINGRDAMTLADLRDSTGQPMTRPDAIRELQQFVTNSLPTTDSDGSGASSYIGDFTKMLLGVRSEILVEVSTDGESAFEKHQLLLKVTWRGDFNCADSEAFCRLSGITA